jgi:hypothetical protein
VGWVESELALVALGAMLSPTTLTFSVLVLVLADRPKRAGSLFYVGALAATLGIGIVAGLLIGDVAASTSSTPKTWVAIVDIVAAVVILGVVVWLRRRPPNPTRSSGALDQMRRVVESPAIAIVGAGATLANPGGFIPLALKNISELDPGPTEYVALWVAFSVVSLLPLGIALVLLSLRPDWTKGRLERIRGWLDRNTRSVFMVLLVLLAAALLRNGIAGLAS